MSVGQQLLATLREEEAALKAHAFDRLADIQRQKEYLAGRLDAEDGGNVLALVHQQAQKNERLLTITLDAIRGVKARFEELGRARRSVGYGEHGDRVSLGEEKPRARL